MIGYNFTSPGHFEICNKLLQHGIIQYVEVMVDNFLSLPTREIARIQAPIGVHIMQSRFLERDYHELKEISAQIKEVLSDISTLYYSDHLLQFTYEGRQLPYLQELDYRHVLQNFKSFEQRCCCWAELLGEEILFENAASLDERGCLQHQFMQKVNDIEGIGILFDITNLFISIYNGAAKLDEWIPMIEEATVFHIGSYNISSIDTTFLIDSHDSPLNSEFMEFLDGIRSHILKGSDIKVTFERDAHETTDSIIKDICKIQEVLHGM